MPEDTPAIYRIFSNDQVTRYHDLVTYTDPRQAEELIDFFDESFELERAIFWGITRQEDGALIGTCGYVWLRTYRGEVSYNLHPDYWKQGYMQEALDAIVDFGFSELGLNRVEALVMVENGASSRLLRRLGFQEEGILRQQDFFKGQFHDMRLFALLAQDYYAE
ncbi:MAG: GNAT family N-acetyltransferase [Caldilineaceae bacterium]|nr:GNAT family N-acetyltransferase [Caldilineaceae bacterium]